MGRIHLKTVAYSVAVAGLIYTSAMIFLRFQMTKRAYDFHEIKKHERALREEQSRLQATLSAYFGSRSFREEWRARGFQEPDPDQVVTIP